MMSSCSYVKCPSCSEFIKMTNSVNDPSSTIRRHCSHQSALKHCIFDRLEQDYEIVEGTSRAHSNQYMKKLKRIELFGNIQHYDQYGNDDDNNDQYGNDDDNNDQYGNDDDNNDQYGNDDDNNDQYGNDDDNNNDYNEEFQQEFQQRPQEFSQNQYKLIESQIKQQDRPSPVPKRFDMNDIVHWIWAFYKNQLPSELPFFGWYEFQQKVLVENDPVHQKVSFNKQQGRDVSSFTVALIFSTANRLGMYIL